MEAAEWTLFNFEHFSKGTHDSVQQFDLHAEIEKLQQDGCIHFNCYKISKGKYYEVECSNDYHELFHSKEELCFFLAGKGLL